MSALEWLLEPWTFDFMVRALMVTLAASTVGALLSAWIIHICWSLLGDAVSHAVLPGVVLAYIVGVPFALGALASAGLALAGIRAVSSYSRIKEDAAIGIVFSSFFALGLVLISVTPSSVDLSHILFGKLLGISDTDFVQVMVLSVLAGALLIARRRALTWFAFDPGHMASLGRSPRRESAVLLGALALVAVASLQAVGIVLVIAVLITPGAIAHLMTNRMSVALWVAPVVSVVVTTVGLYCAYYLDVAPGGAIVLTYAAAFVVAFVAGRYGPVMRRMRTRRALISEGAV